MKKILIIMLLSIVCFTTSMISNKAFAHISNNINEEKICIGKIEGSEVEKLSDIRIKLYVKEKMQLENVNIRYYHNRLLDILISDESGNFQFEEPEEDYYLELDVTTLPKQIGVTNLTAGIENENTFQLRKISNAEVEYNKGDYDIKLFDSENNQLFANLNYDIINANYENGHLTTSIQLSVNGDNSILEKTFVTQEKMNLENEISVKKILRDNIVENWKYVSTRQNKYMIEILNNSSTELRNEEIQWYKDSIELIIQDVENFFLSKGYEIFQTKENYLSIILDISESNKISGSTDTSENVDMNYNIKLNINKDTSFLTIKSLIIHEFFHTIMKKMTNDRVTTYTNQLDEALATFMEFYYVTMENRDFTLDETELDFEFQRLHNFIYSYYQEKLVNNSPYIVDNVRNTYGYQIFDWESSYYSYDYFYGSFVAFLALYIEISNDEMFHNIVRDLLQNIKNNSQFPYYCKPFFQTIDNLDQEYDISIIGLEELISILPFNQSILEQYVSNDFLNYKSDINIWDSKIISTKKLNIKNANLAKNSLINYYPKNDVDEGKMMVIRFSSKHDINIKIRNVYGEEICTIIDNNFTMILEKDTIQQLSMIQFINQWDMQGIEITEEIYSYMESDAYDITSIMQANRYTNVLYTAPENGIYMFSLSINNELQTISNVMFDNVSIKHITNNCCVSNILSKQYGTKKVGVYLKKNEAYCIRINYVYDTQIDFSDDNFSFILHVSSSFNMNPTYVINNYISHFSSLTTIGLNKFIYMASGRYKLSLSLQLPNGWTNDLRYISVAICKYQNNELNILYTGLISQSSRSISTIMTIFENDEVYCIYDYLDMDCTIYLETNRC